LTNANNSKLTTFSDKKRAFIAVADKIDSTKLKLNVKQEKQEHLILNLRIFSGKFIMIFRPMNLEFRELFSQTFFFGRGFQVFSC